MFQDKIKLLRESHGLTKKEIAKAIEISERAYITYEYGQREPSMETIIKLAKYYNVTTDYLLDQETIQSLDQFENLKFTKEMEKEANEDYQKLSPQDKAFIARMVKALVDSRKEHEKQDKKNVP